jgi:putative ABC transport system permease protein
LQALELFTEKSKISDMIRNFFKIAARSILKHKSFSFINISGLSLGLATCFLIALFVWDELQFDRKVADGEQIFRIGNEYSNEQGTSIFAPSPPMFTTALKEHYPEVEQTTRVLMLAEVNRLFEVDDKKIYVKKGFFVDSTYFEVFPHPFKYGNINSVLDAPTSIVLSEDLSERLFGKEDPVGKILLMDKEQTVVKGVFRKDPKFHLQYEYLVPLAAAQIPAKRMKNWGWQQFYSYAKVKEGTDVLRLQAKFQALVKKESEPVRKEDQNSMKPFFQPLFDIHLYSSDFKYDTAQRGNITYVRALSIIALFVLIIACFNFVNLATAKSLQRAKEVGVRKAIGARRSHLIFQFIGETVVLTFISIIIAFAITLIALPWLNNFTGKSIPFDLMFGPGVILLLVGLTLLVGIAAGFYPALVLSGFQPIKVLKGSSSTFNINPGKIDWLRHGLIVVQFGLSILLIISAIVVYKQVDYLHNKDLGFNKEQIMFFTFRGDNAVERQEVLKSELLKIPGVKSASIGYGFPSDAVAGEQIIVPQNGEKVYHSATLLMVDYDYIKTLGLQLVKGRDFSKEMKTDASEAFIINEKAVKDFGFGNAQNALGKRMEWNVWNPTSADSMKVGKVIGVVKDFNFKSLYDKVEPAVLQIFPNAAYKVAVKVESKGIENTLAQVEKTWSRLIPDYPLEYQFLDENFERMYTSEDKLNSLLWVFTSLAIFIGCLGLFGLATYTAEKRKKEIGIRKVLGASVSGIVLLLSKDFVRLVILSLIIASPIAYYCMHQWLQDFAYRIEIYWWIFGLAAFFALAIAFIAVSFQALKAALMNPSESLRIE